MCYVYNSSRIGPIILPDKNYNISCYTVCIDIPLFHQHFALRQHLRQAIVLLCMCTSRHLSIGQTFVTPS